MTSGWRGSSNGRCGTDTYGPRTGDGWSPITRSLRFGKPVLSECLVAVPRAGTTPAWGTRRGPRGTAPLTPRSGRVRATRGTVGPKCSGEERPEPAGPRRSGDAPGGGWFSDDNPTTGWHPSVGRGERPGHHSQFLITTDTT
jgi:hypothetical protein